MSEHGEVDIRDLEQQRCDALLKGDVARLDQLLSDDLLWTHSAGTSDDKVAFLAKIKDKAVQYLAIRRTQELYFSQPNTKIATGLVDMDVLLAGAPRTLRSRYVNVWFTQNGRWRLTLWQSTPLPN